MPGLGFTGFPHPPARLFRRSLGRQVIPHQCRTLRRFPLVGSQPASPRAFPSCRSCCGLATSAAMLPSPSTTVTSWAQCPSGASSRRPCRGASAFPPNRLFPAPPSRLRAGGGDARSASVAGCPPTDVDVSYGSCRPASAEAPRRSTASIAGGSRQSGPNRPIAPAIEVVSGVPAVRIAFASRPTSGLRSTDESVACPLVAQ